MTNRRITIELKRLFTQTVSKPVDHATKVKSVTKVLSFATRLRVSALPHPDFCEANELKAIR